MKKPYYLTQKQWKLVDEYEAILSKMEKEGIAICTDCDNDKHYYINAAKLCQIGQTDQADIIIPTNSLRQCPKIADIWFNSSIQKGIPAEYITNK